MKRLPGLTCVVCAALAASAWGARPPTDNPMATYYSGDRGYPAWTDRIRWSNVIDMKAYAKGATNFERFERARDELADKGGGVLYYPAGTYDFSDGPFDGPHGRGLMLRSGVVIRGRAPKGRVSPRSGRLDLPTRFVFGFKRRQNAVDAGDRLTVELDGADIRVHRRRAKRTRKGEPRPVEVRYEPAPLILSFAVRAGKIQGDVKGFRRGYGRDVWPGEAEIEQDGESIKMRVALTIPAPTGPKAGDGKPGTARYEVALKREGERVSGEFSGTCRDRRAKGSAAGRFWTIVPETPRDWNFIGQVFEKGRRLKDIRDVGLVWVHVVGGTVWFGPDIEWGKTWATAGSWKSDYAIAPWSSRKADGTHPWDPFAGGGRTFVGSGDGRLIFGCKFEQSAVLNESISMGRPDYKEGFGAGGYYMHKFGPRIGVYGSRVFVASNVLALSRGRNFKYEQTTRRTWPAGGSRAGYDPPRKSVVLFDYNKVMGIDVNKDMLGYTKSSSTGRAGEGYFKPGVAVVDNYVFNNGHKGFNISGQWVTIARNHNERQMLREGYDPERIGGWELTLDGHLETSPGGPGYISDNLSRAFDLGGRNVWVHRNTYTNLGSAPGNDGEGILCQAHGGTQVYSWAITYNRHDKGHGRTGYIGGWDVNIAGALFGWNELAGWIGSTNVGRRASADTAFVANKAGGGVKVMKGAQVGAPGGKLTPPKAVKAEVHQGDAVKITWQDAGDNEVGFRVDRKIGGGAWTPIAYRPPRIGGHPANPQAWIDYLAPTGKALTYRVVSLNARDDDEGASRPAPAVTLRAPRR